MHSIPEYYKIFSGYLGKLYSLPKSALSILLLVAAITQISAQNLEHLSITHKPDPRICIDVTRIVDIQPFMSERFSFKLNNCNLLFDNRTFYDLENYFRNDIVLYSVNDRKYLDALSKDFAFKRSNIDFDSNQFFSITYQFNIDHYEFNKFLINDYYFFNNFIKSVERNQFFFDMYTKHNDIYTNEFAILEFPSAEAGQYLDGTKIWGGIGFGMFGLLMLAPKSVTKWKDGYMEDALSNLRRAFHEPPVWDEDHWEINYLGHPYAGSLYYNTIRSQGASVFSSFLFSAFISTGWEYLYEGVAERPSIQDLIVTPVVGAILGETIHQTTLAMRKNGFSIFEAAFVTLFNPMYVILNGYN